jgi:hypothetical protein
VTAASLAVARLDVAWDASSKGLRRHSGYTSAALRFAATWATSPWAIEVRCEATIDEAGRVTVVGIGEGLRAEVLRRGRWTHVAISDESGSEVLAASFDRGRLAHCRSGIPAAAGFPGGSYDAPTAILELYDTPPAPPGVGAMPESR